MSRRAETSSNYKSKLRSSSKGGQDSQSSSSSGSLSKLAKDQRTATKTPASNSCTESPDSCCDIATNLNSDPSRGFKNSTTEEDCSFDFRENLLKPPKITRDPVPRYKRAYVKDIEKCPGVADAILCMCYEQEDRYAIAEDFLHVQDNITWKMHEILLNWLVQVAMQLKFSDAALWLTNNIIQRTLLRIPAVRRRDFQLVGIAALSLACKVEEVRVPYPTDLVYITDKAYNCQQLLDMELKILDAIHYELIVPTTYHFLVRYCELIHTTEATRHLAMYYAERYLHFREGVLCKPTMLAAVALYAALAQRRAEGKSTCSDLTLGQIKQYFSALAEVKDLAKVLLVLEEDVRKQQVAKEAIASLEGALPRFEDRTTMPDVMVPTATELWGLPLSLTETTEIPTGVQSFLSMILDMESADGTQGIWAKRHLQLLNAFAVASRDDVTAEGVEAGVQALLRELPPMEEGELRRRAAEMLQRLREQPEGQPAVRMKFRRAPKLQVAELSLPDIDSGAGFLSPFTPVLQADSGSAGATATATATATVSATATATATQSGRDNSEDKSAGSGSKRRRTYPPAEPEGRAEGLRRSRRIQLRGPDEA